MSRYFYRFAIVWITKITLISCAQNDSPREIQFLTTAFTSCNETDVELGLKSNDANYKDNTIVNCQNVNGQTNL